MLRRHAVVPLMLLVTALITSGLEPASAHTQINPAKSKRTNANLIAKSSVKNSKVATRIKAVRPVKRYQKTSVFKEHTRLYGSRGHSGVDLAAPRGTSVYAVQAGRVVFAAWDGDYGRKIMIDHGDDIVTVYGHLSSIKVQRGQFIKMGARIGTIGTSGRTTGPHLHFELRKHGQLSDPAKWLKSLGVRI